MADEELVLTDEEKALIKKRRKKQWNPCELDSYSAEGKAAKFDELYKLARDHFDTKRKDGWGTKDIEHWCYEAVVGLLGEGVWDALNAMPDEGE